MSSAWKEAATCPLRLFGLFPRPRIGAVLALDPATRDRARTPFGAARVCFSCLLHGLSGLHVAGALRHRRLDREQELQRRPPRGAS